MKNNLKTFRVSLAIYVLIYAGMTWQGCVRTEPEQPKDECDPETYMTSNKFSMVVNGVEWESCAPWNSHGHAGDGLYWPGSGLLQIAGRFACGELFGDTLFSDVMLNLQTWANTKSDTFQLSRIHVAHLAFNYPQQNFTNPDHFNTDSLHTGRVILTRIDTVARIVSGSFEFEALVQDSSKTVKVTEGKFCNVRYDWQ